MLMRVVLSDIFSRFYNEVIGTEEKNRTFFPRFFVRNRKIGIFNVCFYRNDNAFREDYVMLEDINYLSSQNFN